MRVPSDLFFVRKCPRVPKWFVHTTWSLFTFTPSAGSMISYLPNTKPWLLTRNLSSRSSQSPLWYPSRYILACAHPLTSLGPSPPHLENVSLFPASSTPLFIRSLHLPISFSWSSIASRIVLSRRTHPFTTLYPRTFSSLYHTSFNLSLLHSYHTINLTTQKHTTPLLSPPPPTLSLEDVAILIPRVNHTPHSSESLSPKMAEPQTNGRWTIVTISDDDDVVIIDVTHNTLTRSPTRRAPRCPSPSSGPGAAPIKTLKTT
ncbi:hypothetical protein GWK47_044233 [Chionoecetes opilio]|uniref:Uncharacterized protein n=1 Tax=Chionoecetes opilio TaxID=41210 RepID=A0A8J4Y8E4_CHIOP|nr:hypothetical protein GWK47_044233 [Chionoecetes opilio]